jgi:hypothetical protein
MSHQGKNHGVAIGVTVEIECSHLSDQGGGMLLEKSAGNPKKSFRVFVCFFHRLPGFKRYLKTLGTRFTCENWCICFSWFVSIGFH